MIVLGIVLAMALCALMYVVGSRRQARLFEAALAKAGLAAPAGEAGERVAELFARVQAGEAELERLSGEREEQVRAAEQEQRTVNHRLRRRAKEAIDDTGAVISERLGAVVEQVGAARQAAVDTQERVSMTSAAASAMVRRARSADEAASALNGSLHKVAGIAQVISEIASQTRMLALNATIEAARAGGAGKGFAVVADEVKNLAGTTATSSGEIAETIAALESDVTQMSQTLAAIIQDVGEIESAMGMLDGIADDQHAIVERLNDTVDATMSQIQDLSDVAERLERRRAERLTATGPVRLRSRSGVQEGRLIDLSASGFGCIVPAASPIQVGHLLQAELELGAGPLRVDAEVKRRRPTDGGTELGLSLRDPGIEARRQITEHVNRALEGA